MRSRSRIIACLLINRIRRNRKGRRFSVHPLHRDRDLSGEYSVKYNKLREDPDEFQKYFRMSMSTYDELFEKLYKALIPKHNVRRRTDELDPGLKLTVLLRYLATGTMRTTLANQFKIGRSTMSVVTRKTCNAIVDIIGPEEMPPITRLKYKTIAEDFFADTGFPNCLGVLNARRIHILTGRKKLKQNPTLFFVTDSKYYITAVDYAPSSGDSHKCLLSSTKNKLTERLLKNYPKFRRYEDTTDAIKKLRHVFVAPATFGLTDDTLKSYTGRILEKQQIAFNRRVNKLLRYSDIAYALLSKKWGIFEKFPKVPASYIDLLTQTACILHNFILRRDGYDFADTLDCIADRKWAGYKGRATKIAKKVRDGFANYFLSVEDPLDTEELEQEMDFENSSNNEDSNDQDGRTDGMKLSQEEEQSS